MKDHRGLLKLMLQIRLDSVFLTLYGVACTMFFSIKFESVTENCLELNIKNNLGTLSNETRRNKLRQLKS